jgi:3-oxoacyl-[acyl-carrier-protein] synthase II
MKRTVITGIGAVTPLGNDIESTWNNLANKNSGVAAISKFDPTGLPSHIAGELKQFCPEDYIPKKDVLRLDPFVHYAAAAALMAAEDAGLISSQSSGRTSNALLDPAGIIIGSSRGGILSMDNAMERYIMKGRPFSSYLMSSSTINMASSFISMQLGTKGITLGISTACASGTNAIGEAFRMIQHGEVDIALAGGSEAPVCRLAVGGYGASGALSGRNSEPEKASRPFDSDRDGFVISEGAAVLVLEEHDRALRRGAGVYAELAGYGTSSDSFHQTKPDIDGEALAIRNALKNANITINEVDYINAHATSTPLGDAAEAKAINEVFGNKVNEIYVSSYKSMLGHMLGAAGSLEAAVTAISINRGTVIPTINLDDCDPACGLNHVTSALNKEISIAVTNSFGFGGVNAVLVLKRFEEQDSELRR